MEGWYRTGRLYAWELRREIQSFHDFLEPRVAAKRIEQRIDEHGRKPAVAIVPGAFKRGEGFVKVMRDTRYDEVLGVHMIGPHATDLIAEACVALKLETTTEELLRTMHAHPTLSEAVAEAAHAATGHALHL